MQAMHTRRRSNVAIACVVLVFLCIGFILGLLFGCSSISRSGHAGRFMSTVESLVKGGHEMTSICTNTCLSANNGICDEGRLDVPAGPKESNLVKCDLGTDCGDCGPWTPAGLVPWIDGKEKGPIKYLTTKGRKVQVKRTLTPDPFLFAYADEKQDIDVSRIVHDTGILERAMTEIFYKIFRKRCTYADGQRALFVDVGANFGWFTLLAAKMGCRVVAFEPVPLFRSFLHYNLHVNGLTHLVDVHAVLVSEQSGVEREIVVPDKGIWGTASIDGMNIDPDVPSGYEAMRVKSVRLDDIVKEEVILMKVDVEGWEWSVLQGAAQLLKQYDVENVIMEYSPGAVEKGGNHTHCIATIQMLLDLLGLGYRIGHIQFKEVATSWGQPNPEFPEVTSDVLKYDMEDAVRRQSGVMGCPMPEPLRKFGYECNNIPADFNPRSFRSNIWHNTNIWASKNLQLLRLNEAPTGMFKHSEPSSKYFLNHKWDWSIGVLSCNKIDDHRKVRYRCACLNLTACGDQVQAFTDLANQGLLPNNYVLS